MNQKKAKIEVTIYTDGGCMRNPGGKGGIGVVLLHKKGRKELSQGYTSTTANRMELRAVIEAFRVLKGEGYYVTVFSDSQYVVNSIEKGWKKKANKDLWEEMNLFLCKHICRFIWVRGHAETVENNRCDALATMAMHGPNLIPDHGYNAF